MLRYPDYQEINWINNVTDSYNIKLAEMAIDNGGYFADIAGEFDNHGSCSAAAEGSYLYGAKAIRKTDLGLCLSVQHLYILTRKGIDAYVDAIRNVFVANGL
ncbi:MAG: hypothetical protein LBP35_00735 [Candidatus Ancillula trichonymphae]|nr:hypothetical protein [Candidatus Ancillula trichonymphae]